MTEERAPTAENITQAINSFWNVVTAGEYDKAKRAEINVDFPQLLITIAIHLDDHDKIRWLQQEYGGEECWRLANKIVTPWCNWVLSQLCIEGPSDDRPSSPDSILSVNNIRL